jgi:2-haloacid dehalogenase
MPARAPLDIRVLAFDVFGTVVDWRTGVITELTAIAHGRDLAVDAAAVADAWRDRYQPMLDAVRRGERPWQVLDELHRAALEELIVEFSLQALSEEDRRRLVMAWHHLPPWPDAIPGLTRLRDRYILATFSNGGMALLVDLIRAGRLPFDCILSTELVKSYKPDPRTYQLVPSLLAIRPDQAMMVAAHPYDLVAAAEQGMRTAFVRRPLERGTGMADLPDLPVDIVAVDFLDLASQLEMVPPIAVATRHVAP